MLDRSSSRYISLLFVLDIAVTVASLALATWLRPQLPFGERLVEPGGRVGIVVYLTAALVWSIILPMVSAYDVRRLVRARDEAQTVFAGVTQGTLVLAGFLYLTFRYLSRLLFITFYVIDLALILAVRLILRLLLKGNGAAQPGHRVMVVGVNKVAASVGERIGELRWIGLELAGYISEDGIPNCENPADDGAGQQTLNGPVLGRLADVPALVRSLNISELIIALPLRAHEDIPNMISDLSDVAVSIKVVPDFFDLVYLRSSVEELGGMPLIGLKEPVIPPYARAAKRVLDVFVSSLALILSSPVVAVVALMIKLDSPGPIIFRQQRVGEGGRLFWMYKFRTMVADAEKRESELMARSGNGQIVFQKRPDDPRLTRLGRLLRRFSLDEIPQFVNVLKGDMSLVGPRPELPLIVDSYAPWQRKRFAVPPGMTGWWQVHSRSQQPLHLRTEDDLYYIQNYSLLLDVRILCQTVGAVISGRGAY
jgi:exopolysaccharide biosynthesis polyprenyl glycosylphosphotransferase